jgi:radical SAM protein with 4Fe4S-binding SPASM domain
MFSDNNNSLENDLKKVISEKDKEIMINMKRIYELEYKVKELQELHEAVTMRHWEKPGIRQKLVCLKPFKHFEITSNGDVYLCCPTNMKYGLSIGNVYEQSIEEIWNSDTAKKLRYSVCKGDFEYCNKFCDDLVAIETKKPKLKNLNYIELRNREEMGLNYKNYKKCHLKYQPTHFILSCDPTCNLTCPTCRRTYLTLSNEEINRLDKMLNEKILPLMNKAEKLMLLTSGDFLCSPSIMNFLKKLKSDECPKLRIQIYTNAQLFTRERWKEFTNLNDFHLELAISIDAAQKETYEKMRRGGKWETLQENLAFISELRENNIINYLMINFLIQEDNYQEIEDFVKMGLRFGVDCVVFQRISNWGAMSLEEFAQKNICDENNPKFKEVKKTLKYIFKKYKNQLDFGTNIKI